MVLQQRAAMTNPNAPAASIEAILHAILPFKFVDHSHANAISALTCAKDGEARVKDGGIVPNASYLIYDCEVVIPSTH